MKCCIYFLFVHCAYTGTENLFFKAFMLNFSDLSKAQRSFCNVLKNFTLNYIGEIDTPDEIEIGE